MHVNTNAIENLSNMITRRKITEQIITHCHTTIPTNPCHDNFIMTIDH